jgi:hypothetical protein
LGSFCKVLPYEFPSAQAIALSDCVIHAGSTMAIEAHLLGVPSLTFCNCNPDHRLASVVPMCCDFSQLSEVLGRMCWGHSNINESAYQWLVEHLYGQVDGKACERAAGAIEKAIRARGKKFTLETPNEWPHEVLYPADTVRFKPEPGYNRVLCVACKGQFWLKDSETWTFCPFCAMTLRKMIVGEQLKKVV